MTQSDVEVDSSTVIQKSDYEIEHDEEQGEGRVRFPPEVTGEFNVSDGVPGAGIETRVSAHWNEQPESDVVNLQLLGPVSVSLEMDAWDAFELAAKIDRAARHAMRGDGEMGEEPE